MVLGWFGFGEAEVGAGSEGLLGLLLSVGGFGSGSVSRILLDSELGDGWDGKTGFAGQFGGLALGGAADGTCGHGGNPFRGTREASPIQK